MKLDWEKIARRYTHTTKIEILEWLMGVDDGSPAEFARERGLAVSVAGYSMRALARDGYVEATRERPVRGSIEHFYRLAPKVVA